MAKKEEEKKDDPKDKGKDKAKDKGKEKTEGDGAPAEGEPKKSKKKLIIIIVVAVVLLAVIAGGVFFALKKKGGGEAAGEDTEQSADEADSGDEPAAKESDKKDEKEEEDTSSKEKGTILPLDPIIVNLQVKGSFLKVTMHLQFNEILQQEETEKKMPIIRNAVIRLLSAKAAADILTPDGKEQLSDEIVQAVNEGLGTEEISGVYFTEFIVQ